MFQYEFQAWSYLARSWQTLQYFKRDYVFNVEFDSDGLCICIEKMRHENMISVTTAEKMLLQIEVLLDKSWKTSKDLYYLFPRDQQGAESRRKLCLQLAFQNIIEEHNGKLPTIN